MRNLFLAFGAIVVIGVGAACGGGSGSKTATPEGSSADTSALASNGSYTPSADVATQVAAASTAKALVTLAAEVTVLPNGTVVTASGQAVPPELATQAAAAATAAPGQAAPTPPVAQATPCVFNNNAPGCATAPPEATAIAPGAQGIAIDSNPATPNVDTAGVTAASGGTFSVGINIVTAPAPYEGYEWDLVLDGPVKFVSGTPDKPAGLTICSTPTNTNPTGNDWYAGCISTDKQITYTGRVDTAILQCTGAGTAQLRLKKQSEGGSFGTDLLNSQSQPITGDVGPAIAVTCT
jgi:hypothetical protein